jgi:glycine hydroxymethyltransferase
MKKVSSEDPEIANLITKEILRQKEVLNMIPSENYCSEAVLDAVGSVLMNKYSEGYPKKRYYQGQENIDPLELLAISRAKKLFNVEHVNVQPYSGSPANFAVYNAVCEPGDIICGMALPDGGHLTHGWNVSVTSKYFKSVQYHVKPDGYIDFDEIRKIALEYKPKLMWCGATAYPREFPFEEFAKIADEINAYFAADIAHIAGLVAGEAHKSPVPHAHIITTTTHKTLRGPRGGLIMITKKGLEKDPELAKKIDRSIFPGLQGGPHQHTIAGIAVALGEALKPDFKKYANQIVKNCKELAQTLMNNNIKLVSNGTDNHLLLIDLTSFGIGLGKPIAVALEKAGICVNANSIPKDPSTPFKPSGIRLGTPILTTRGMKEQEMKLVGNWISQIIKNHEDEALLLDINEQVKQLCSKFPVYREL